MPGEKRTFTREAYTSATAKARASGSATHEGEQRHRAGKGLHELVDPKGYGAIRRSISWLEPKGDDFILLRGTAMLVESRLDTTSSMGRNVDIAMRVLPDTYDLLKTGDRAVLKRYDIHMITSIFGDVVDDYILCRSQAEMDERIAEQMMLMVPCRGGGDADEDPQYGLFGAAYLTSATAVALGLKTYDFTVTDARGREFLTLANLKRVFGDDVLDKVAENGHQINSRKLPTTAEVVGDLLKISHAFLLAVDMHGDGSHLTGWWKQIYGQDRVVTLPSVELLPVVQAVIIGLTEGNLDLQNLEEYLQEVANLNAAEARRIQRVVAGIPIGAQAALPNFHKIPMKGARFAKKGDLWPIDEAAEKPGKKKKEQVWL